jgi:LysR family hydrogen peroxide-inducible transcriptional activator
MTLQDLRYLVALVDHNHFGRAAQACHIGQPTLSTQIKKLEEQLGVTLFERTNKSIHVTAAGAEVAARARQILADAEALLEVGRRDAGPLAGAFSLGVIPTLGPYLLPWLVPALKKRHPKLQLAVCEDLTDQLLDGLVSYRLNAALVALPISDSRLEALPLFDEPFWFASPRGHTLAKRKVVKEDDLHGERLLLLTEGHCLRDQALAICGTTVAKDAGDWDFRATSLETIREMVATGMGSTLLPAMACGDFRHRESISLRPLEGGVGRRIGLVWRRRYPRPRDLSLMAETLCDHLPRDVRPVRTARRVPR